MDTGWAFASFISKGLTQTVPIADRDGGAGSVVDIQVYGGKQLLLYTDALPPKPHGDLPASKALISIPCRVLGQTVHPLPHPCKCSVPG